MATIIPETTICSLTFPHESILLVTLNKPEKLNCLTHAGHRELDNVWKWMDSNTNILLGIITGSGRAFCGGADLRDWIHTPVNEQGLLPPSGFGGISMRVGKKPVIAAVNGMSVGGGAEMVLNCDIVVGSEEARLILPDVKVGLTLLGGALPRLVRAVGKQRATLMCLTGRPIGAQQALEWGLISVIAKDPVDEALKIGIEIIQNSPDAILATRDGLMMGWSGMGVDEAGKSFINKWWPSLRQGENSKEGIKAFLERRRPKWTPSKL